jgi:hypothetical protein
LELEYNKYRRILEQKHMRSAARDESKQEYNKYRSTLGQEQELPPLFKKNKNVYKEHI